MAHNSLLLFLVLIYDAMATPNITSRLCATMCQSLTVNNSTVVQSACFPLCIDGVALRWTRTNPPEQGGQQLIFNGSTLFTLTSNASATGGYSCVRKTLGPDKPSNLPYSMLLLDNGTVFNTTENLDGVDGVEMWSHFRPAKAVGPIHTPAMEMHWHVAPSSGASQELLRTSCIQASFQPGAKPGDVQSGDRDFSKDYTTALPTFAPPAGVNCEADSGAFVPSGDCKPGCAAGSLCCKDPAPGSAPACFDKITDCSALPGQAHASDAFAAGLPTWLLAW